MTGTTQGRSRTLYRPASGGARTLALLVDYVLVFALVALVWWLRPSMLLSGTIVVECALVLTFLRATTGRTPGLLLMRLAAVSHGTSHAPGLGTQCARSALMALLHVTVLGPLVTTTLTRNGQDWVDRICGTQTLDLRHQAVQLSASALTGPGTGPVDPHTVAEDPATMVQAAAWNSSSGSSPYGRPTPSRVATPTQVTPSAPAPTRRSPAPAPAPVTPRPRATSLPSAPAAPVPASTAHSSSQLPLQPPPAPYAPAPTMAPSAATETHTGTHAQEQTNFSSQANERGVPMLPTAPPSQELPSLAQSPADPAGQPPTTLLPNLHSLAPAPTPLWVVVDTGEREPVDTVLVIGRAPAAREANGERAVTIADSTRSLSRTHLRLGRSRTGAWVEDARSANGTTVRSPEGAEIALPSGGRKNVPIGTVIIMGQRSLTITDSR